MGAETLILLGKGHSPEQIAGILRRMHPGDPDRNASHETLYTAIYAMPRGELRTEVIGLLVRLVERADPVPGAKIGAVRSRTGSRSTSGP